MYLELPSLLPSLRFRGYYPTRRYPFGLARNTCFLCGSRPANRIEGYGIARTADGPYMALLCRACLGTALEVPRGFELLERRMGTAVKATNVGLRKRQIDGLFDARSNRRRA